MASVAEEFLNETHHVTRPMPVLHELSPNCYYRGGAFVRDNGQLDLGSKQNRLRTCQYGYPIRGLKVVGSSVPSSPK